MTVVTADVSVTPGTRIDERYRLDSLLDGRDGSSLWRGNDELLKRSVAVQVFEPGAERLSEVFDAVRQVCRLTHGGLAQVFDANEDADPPYFVREWLGGRDLQGVLADGPLDPEWAVEAFRQASAAIAAAHRAGVYHQHIEPRSIVWSKAGRIKVVGLAVDAALAGTRANNPQLVDSQALAWLLWFALSGRCSSDGDLARVSRAPAWRSGQHRLGRDLIAIAQRALREGRDPLPMDQFAADLERLARYCLRAGIRPSVIPASAEVGRS
jgi:eukaryotic-like serine/threonine-protein kinase